MKDDLFGLIKAMAPAEKRYFKVNSKKLSGEKAGKAQADYVDLFELLNQMDELDDQKLRKVFGKRLADTRAYLYDAILRSMRAYRSKRFLYSQIKDKIIDARYLLDVGLYEQAEYCLEEAKQMAESSSDTLSLLEINRECRKLLRRTFTQEKERNLLTHTHALHKLETQMQEEFWALSISDQVVVETNRVMRSENRLENERLRQEFAALLDDANTPQSVRAQLTCFQIRVVLLYHLGENARGYEESKKGMALWDQHPVLQEEEPFSYINDLANLFHLAISQQDFAHAALLQKKFEAYKPQSFHEESWWFRKFMGADLILRINTGDTNNLDDIAEKIQTGIARFDVAISGQFHFYVNLAMLQFMAEQYERCIESCELLVRRHQIKDRQDARVAAGILRVIAMYELEHDDFENALRASDRLLEKEEIGFLEDFEQTLLAHLRVLNRAPEKERRPIWQKMEQFIIEKNNSLMGIGTTLRYWVVQHLTGESIVQQIKREALRNT
ncbi:hypothetical protein Halhy_1169 [Haliscomenobacter hydrossis DSM 1100]|uniref:Uncharacterized protein n=2 Tax=Haliscomenobacter TaxID=2349 RepID=F4KSW0_HALH1|nr:hypothetical protein Halhy_1169 [Haliscomenobacter hydrossis DSM 1100]